MTTPPLPATLRRHAASVVTVGTFDGVHRGHRVLLEYLLERAREQDGTATVVTFDPHPREVVTGEPVPLLTTVEERRALLYEAGVERVVVLPFTEALRRLPAERFVTDVLVERVGLREIVVGYDHGFGKGRKGDAQLLERLGAEHSFDVDVVPEHVVSGHEVSSSEVRKLLLQGGNVTLVAELLGRPYRLGGTVERGDARGRTIGYPTANLGDVPPRKVLPRSGVYAAMAETADGEQHGAMVNIGQRPTFDGQGVRIEAHLFDFDGDLYGQPLHLDFLERLRDEQRFDGVDALRSQLAADEEAARAALADVRAG